MRVNSLAFFLLALTPVLESSSIAEAVLKDHITSTANWEGQSLIAHGFPPGAPNGVFGASATFVGDGGTLKTISAVFAHDSAFGVVNGGTPTALDFRFSFFPDLATYKTDPFFESGMTSGIFQRFDTVSNLSDWLIAQGLSRDGHDLFIWEVDVESLGIRTTPGQTHVVSLIPETNGLSGPTFLASSTGLSATGLTEDWFASRTVGPDTLRNIGSPLPNAAYRITTIPEPSSATLLAMPTMVLAWLSSRRRSLRQFRL